MKNLMLLARGSCSELLDVSNKMFHLNFGLQILDTWLIELVIAMTIV